MPENRAAWLDRSRGDLVVGPADLPVPGPHEVVLRARAVAVNPLDVVKQQTGDLAYRWLPYPCVLGEDVAGEVVEVGSAVTRFRPGDRVLAYTVGMEKVGDHRTEGAFQLYPVAREGLTAPLPEAMAFEDAAVLPLGISTAASALFQADQLGLRPPVAAGATGATGGTGTTGGTGATGPREAVVVWGASTSVGANAVQLAVAAGYVVVATASPHNHDRARRLGASHVLDYRSPTVVADIVAALAGTPVAGVLAVGTGSAGPCVDVAVATGCRRVALTSPSVALTDLPRRPRPVLAVASLGLRLAASTVPLMLRSRLRGVRTRFVWGSSLMTDEVGPMLWERFLPAALADGRYVAAPSAEVVGTGLEHVQPALDRLRAGVSARKLVVRL